MRLQINSDVCQGHGLCVAYAPDVFDMVEAGDDRERAAVLPALVDRIPEELEARARGAEARCPEQAIVLIED